MDIGELQNGEPGFACNTPVDDSMARIAAEYIDRYGDHENGWPWIVWLNLTDERSQAAHEIEPEYHEWARQVRKQRSQ